MEIKLIMTILVLYYSVQGKCSESLNVLLRGEDGKHTPPALLLEIKAQVHLSEACKRKAESLNSASVKISNHKYKPGEDLDL